MNASAEESGLVLESRKHKSFLGTEALILVVLATFAALYWGLAQEFDEGLALGALLALAAVAGLSKAESG